MKRDNKAIKKIITVLSAMALLATTAFASDWEMRIKAETASKASNSLSFGQKTDATDLFDGQYEVPAYVSGDISAYFSHFEWGQETDKYWRDIKGSGESKSWGIKVEGGTSGQTVTLSWDKSKIPAGYTATLTDSATNTATDMKATASYTYANTGPREFTIKTAATVETAEADTTAPAGSVSINSAAAYTTSSSVTLSLSCTDASGCSQMQFSNNNSTWSSAEAYAASKAWTLSGGDGTKAVYVKFKDTVGNWSGAVSDTIPLMALSGNIDSSSFSSNRVDGYDLIVLSRAFGSTSGSTTWNPVCDLDGNSAIDGSDLVILGSHFGEAQ